MKYTIFVTFFHKFFSILCWKGAFMCVEHKIHYNLFNFQAFNTSWVWKMIYKVISIWLWINFPCLSVFHWIIKQNIRKIQNNWTKIREKVSCMVEMMGMMIFGLSLKKVNSMRILCIKNHVFSVIFTLGMPSMCQFSRKFRYDSNQTCWLSRTVNMTWKIFWNGPI